ncbi:VWA domain-containing protein [Propionibacteriaceae bacterium Y2011]|uniref:VWA domain-containing protein n=1 Tax=Microlunatus sp. Y2014 TaxID=3418488 RepID=UPI003B4C970C
MAMIPMIEFLAPWRLWWLLLVPVLGGLYLVATWLLGRKRLSRGRSSLDSVIPREPGWRRHLAVGLSILSLFTLTIAYAQPKTEVAVPRERATIVVAIDVSKSMEATDVDPSRLEAAKKAAADFVRGMPDKFNVSLVTFAATSRLVVPPTTDHALVVQQIENLYLQPGTAIGEGIYSSLESLLLVPPDPDDPDAEVPARIVLLSDGKTQTGRSADMAAKEAKEQNVPIYTIAYGTKDGVIITEGGREEPVPVDYPELANVAKVSGGKAYAAESASQLEEVYDDISSSVGVEMVDQEVTSQYAGLGLLLAVLAAAGLASLAARWP